MKGLMKRICFSSMPGKRSYFSKTDLNPYLVNAQYAVRGELAIKAEQLRAKLNDSPTSLPFDKITNCNIGNPQQLNQIPITFFRQVISLLEYPNLLDPKNINATSQLFPPDAIDRAAKILAKSGPLGAYSHSKGIPFIRKSVAEFIEKRDGFPSNPEHIFLTAGASPAVQMVLNAIIKDSNVGILIPIPQYPLYSASIALYNGKMVPYYLDEENDWSLSSKELAKAISKARSQGIDVRAICFINPGNPTGNCLSQENLQEMIKICQQEKLVLLADEVYQSNIFAPNRSFISAKKVLKSMGSEFDSVPLFSFHSISKGMLGECGRRGGYVECVNVEEDIIDELYKLASISLCPNISGQLMVHLMVDPPQPNDFSHPQYKKELSDIHESLKRRAAALCQAFNSLEGVTCNQAQGAMYIFPQLRLPKLAIEEARRQGKEPDTFYCLELLDATGVCVVPGSGFGQKEGTFHLRSTFLPPEGEFSSFIERIRKFHTKFMQKYTSSP